MLLAHRTERTLDRQRTQATQMEPTAMAETILKRYSLTTAMMYVAQVVEQKAEVVTILGRKGSFKRKQAAGTDLAYWQRVAIQLIAQHNATITRPTSEISHNGKLKRNTSAK